MTTTRFRVAVLRLGMAAALLPLCAAGAAALTSSQQQALKSACQSDYRANCASVPPGGSEALQCLQTNLSKLSASCQQAVTSASGGGAATTPAAATPAPATAPAATAPAKPKAQAATPPPPMPPLTPRQEAMIVRQYCGADFARYCSTVRLGAGNGVACLRKNAARLSGGCKQALAAAMR